VNGLIALIADEAIVLSTYKDSGGVKTIGVGHTASAGGLDPQIGDKITLRQALKIFIDDVGKFERGVLKALDKVDLKQHEFDGFLRFHFNTGAIQTGTVDEKWEAGDRDGAIRTLKAYINDNGKKVAGLKTRRAEEAEMILRGIYPKHSSLNLYDRYPGALRRVPVEEVRTIMQELLGRKDVADVVVPPKPVSDAKAGARAVIVGGGGGAAAAVAAGWPWEREIGRASCRERV
jgi:lysozyme